MTEGGFLLGSWPSHLEYQSSLTETLSTLAKSNPHLLREFKKPISKLFILNLDPLKLLIAPLYSHTGKPSNQQSEIYRAFVLMVDLGLSLTAFLKKLKHNPVLQAICGFKDKLPGAASFHDFINRLIKIDEKSVYRIKSTKPVKKLGKEKMPPKHPGIVQRLVDQIMCGRRLDNRPERLIQEVFAAVSVRPSINLGLVSRSPAVSGDGTCISTAATHFGRRTCKCNDFHCSCPRKFSDPNATWGWDSHNERYFYGYMGYFISTHNKADKVDLPLYIRIVGARRHDSISAVLAIAELRDLYPDLNIASFISDSASDNYATYSLLNHFGINAVIDLNNKTKGQLKYQECVVNGKGVPICPAEREMVHWGFSTREKFRIKWRCPRVCRKLDATEACFSCSPSPYGRTVHTKHEWDIRIFTKIPRSCDHFKELMKQRTAAERVNNRILNNYGLNSSKVRGRKRITFFASIAGGNIHLDAQLAKMVSLGLFDFHTLFSLSKAA